MATQTSHYHWTLPATSDAVDISVLNNNFSGIDDTVYSLSNSIGNFRNISDGVSNLPPYTNANDIRQNGTWKAYEWTNTPNGHSIGILSAYCYDSGYGHQLFDDYTDGGLYRRQIVNNSWGEWNKLVTGEQYKIANLDTVSSFLSGTHKIQHGWFDGNTGGTKPFTDGHVDIYIWRNNGGTSDYIVQVAYEDDRSCVMKIRGYIGTSGWSDWQDIYNNSSLFVERKNFPSESRTAAAGASTSFTLSVAKSGYTPIGVVGIMGSRTSSFAIQEYALNGNNVTIYFRNLTSTSMEIGNLSIDILYKKS